MGALQVSSNEPKPAVLYQLRHTDWSGLSRTLRKRLEKGKESVSRIRRLVARESKISTMPPIQIVDEIWAGTSALGQGLLGGRATPLKIERDTWFGVEVPAPTVVCKDYSLLRAILVHEFAHCFYYLELAVNQLDSGDTRPLLGPKHADFPDTESWDNATMVDVTDWFCQRDVEDFIQHADPRLNKLDEHIFGGLRLADEFPVVLPSLRFSVAELVVPPDVVDHIRRLREERSRHPVSGSPTV